MADRRTPDLVRAESIDDVRPFDMIDEGLFVIDLIVYPLDGRYEWIVVPIHKGWQEIEGHRHWEPVYGDPVDIEPTFPRTVIRGAEFPELPTDALTP